MVKNSGDCGSRQAVETVFSGGRRWWWFSWWSYSEVLWRLWSRACTSAEIRLSDRAKITLASNFYFFERRPDLPVFLASDHVVVNGCTSRPSARQGHEKEWYDIVLPPFFLSFFLFCLVSNLGTFSPQARTGTMTRNLSAPTPA